MPSIKILVVSTNLLLLLVGLLVWLVGNISKNPARKRIGLTLLSVWVLYDLIGLILAFSLGWFK
jgi:hypothetical protein